MAEVIDFLNAIVGGDRYLLAELRAIRGGAVRQDFFGGDEYPPLQATAEQLDYQGWDVYYGVLPRVRRAGGDADCLSTPKVLWQDIDVKNLEGGHMAALMNLQRSGLDPSILIDSGNGLHAYHLLSQATTFDRARAAMKGMARVVGGDHTYNAGRVLRLPGTHNHKACDGHIDCKPVRILHFDPGRKYRISDFDRFIVPEPPRFTERSEWEGKRDWSSLPDWLHFLVEEGAPQGQRSEACFKAILWLVRYGWNREDILELFLRTPEGIGQKMAEKKNGGMSWFALTYRAAREAALSEDEAA